MGAFAFELHCNEMPLLHASVELDGATSSFLGRLVVSYVVQFPHEILSNLNQLFLQTFPILP